MALLTLQSISKSFGGKPLLDEVTLQIEPGERICIVGRNGEGKSTLLKIVEASLAADSGEIIRQQGLKVRRMCQEVPLDLAGPVEEIIAQGLGTLHNEWESHQLVDRILSLVGLENGLHFEDLSGGQKRRVLLARALVDEPDLLLLDEPTNHLDIEAIQWLETFLLRWRGTLLFVTHDRAFLRRLATRIVEIDRGRLHSWACDYDTYLRRKQALLDGEVEQWAQFDKKLAQEEVWIRKGIKARRTRNEGRVRALEQMRIERRQRRERTGSVSMQIVEAERSGRKVITAKGVTHDYGRGPIIRDFDTVIMRGDKIGIIGPNGCGKSTLIKILLGQLQPTLGTIDVGTPLEIAYFVQHRAILDDDKSVAENVCPVGDTVIAGGQPKHILGYLQDFLFSPERARQPVRLLSGGERNRLLLAKLLLKPSNMLVLDEPTNDLDAETLDLLEELLTAYEGTVLLVSHDRSFLDEVVTSTLVFEGDGVIRDLVGGYGDWLRWKTNRLAEAKAGETAKTEGERPKIRTGKLNNKDRQALDALPKTIAALEAELEALNKSIGAPDFYKRSRDEMASLQARADAIPTEIETAMARWLELEELAASFLK